MLGPLLFHTYVNDITDLSLSEHSRLSIYTDDMLLYKPVCSDISYEELHQDIHVLSLWSDENNMLSNKCKCMLLTNKRNVSPITFSLNQPVEYVKCHKYLGLTVSHNLITFRTM